MNTKALQIGLDWVQRGLAVLEAEGFNTDSIQDSLTPLVILIADQIVGNDNIMDAVTREKNTLVAGYLSER